MSVGRFRRWALLFLLGWAGCGSPPARLTPATPESPAPISPTATSTPISPTATSTRTTTPTSTWTPTKQAPAVASPTARPTATKAQAFMPQPLPEGFQTEGNWIVLQVDTYRRDEIEKRERSDLWFTDGQRWLGPIPLREDEAWSLQRAFWRRQGEAFELCATLKTRSICIPSPPGISFSAPEPSSIRAEACRNGQAICVTGPDGATREFPLPADLIEDWQALPLCVSRDRWVIVEVFARIEGEEAEPVPMVYRLDMARGLYERVSGDEEARAERIRAFRRHGILPEWISWAYDPERLEPEMCSPDTRFYLIHFGGGMGDSTDSVWILRIEDGALYPLPGPEARWVWPEREGQ